MKGECSMNLDPETAYILLPLVMTFFPKHYHLQQRVVKLKSSEFHVEAVLRTDLQKEFKEYKHQNPVQNFCLAISFLPRHHASCYNQYYREALPLPKLRKQKKGKTSVVCIKSSCFLLLCSLEGRMKTISNAVLYLFLQRNEM